MKIFNLNYMKLRDKWLLMYVLSVFIPIVATNVVFYHVTTVNIRSQKIRDAALALDNLRNDLRVIIDQAVGLSYSLYADPLFNKTLVQHFPSKIDYIEAYNSYLKGTLSDPNVQGVRWYQVYTDNPTVMSSGNIEQLTEAVRNTDWYSNFKSSTAPYPSLIYSNQDQAFSLIQRLDNDYTGGIEQLLKIDMNMDLIRQYFMSSGFDGKVYFVDPDGLVRYGNEPLTEGPTEQVKFKDITLPKNSLQFESDYNGINYLEGWSLRGVMDEEIVLQEVRRSRSFVVWMACINIVLPTMIIAAMSRSIHVRLVRILKHMKKVKAQNFQTIPHEEARDEIGQLTIEFNRMTETIRNLIHEVYIADIRRKDLELKEQQAQLHALYSQINPHSLFNTLESIRMRSLIKGERETAKIIHNMAKMFRTSIAWGKNEVTVSEELDFIQNFLEIQKYRFGDKLEYSIQADPAALDCKIPKMVILPFVENASIHGIESAPGKGIIKVSAVVKENKLSFKLEDNGIGMSRAKLTELRQYLVHDAGMGERVGMKNAYYRLKLCYQDRFSFKIDSSERKGTRIEIELPLEAGETPA